MVTKKEWGQSKWFYLHTLASNYDPKDLEQRKDIIQYIKAMVRSLPCHMCRAHAIKWEQEHPVENYMETREMFERYIYDFHEQANQNQKRTSPHTFEQVQQAFRGGKWIPFGGYSFLNSDDDFLPFEYKQKFENLLQSKTPDTGIEYYHWIYISIISVLIVLLVAFVIYAFKKRAVLMKKIESFKCENICA